MALTALIRGGMARRRVAKELSGKAKEWQRKALM